jgi:hypothetical protein
MNKIIYELEIENTGFSIPFAIIGSALVDGISVQLN